MTAIQQVLHSIPPDDLATLSAWIGDLIQEFDEHPDDEVRTRVFALLDGIDALHRAALERLVTLLHSPGAEVTWGQAQTDPLIRTVLQLYDLTPASEPKRFPPSRPPGTTIPLTLVSSRRATSDANDAFEPEWHDVTGLASLPAGTMDGFRIANRPMLLCHIDGELFAYDDACPDTPLTLSNGELDGEQIVCPWHGCRFNARTGQRIVHRGTNLISYPLTIDDDVVRVAVNMRGST